VDDLTSENVVASGALAGQKLEPGAFATPEVDYDGKRIYFAYSGNRDSYYESIVTNNKKPYFHTSETAYHLFCVNADGKVYVATNRSVLHTFRAGREPEILGSYRFRRHPSTVEAADGLLLVATHRDLILFSSD
jgi:hypothetical protein